MDYIIISPVRNEEAYIEFTIKSIIQQNIKPSQWLVVNDGSTDNTEDIIRRYANDHPWIKIINKKNRGFTEVGRGVIEAFNCGLQQVSGDTWDYIVKLDCDLMLGNDYFETLLKNFDQNSYLGITGGTSYLFQSGKKYEEKMPIFHPFAAARMYRRKCFDDIGGLKECLGWDTIDLLRAQMKGWQTTRLSELEIKHLRVMSSRKGLWEGKVRLGRNFYITGYHPVFLFARSLYRLTQRPYFVETFGVLYGYFTSMFKKEELVVTKEEKSFFRRQQIRRLFGLKE